jgi:Domain of unknown function (DUF4326)
MTAGTRPGRAGPPGRIAEERVPGRAATSRFPRRVRVAGDLFHGAVPGGAVYVGRAAPGLQRSIFANPYPARDGGRIAAVRRYRGYLASRPELAAAARRDLAGRDLACWCPLPAPGEPDDCHAAVLLEAAAVRVLTVRQPHAHLLICGAPGAGIKDVENRARPTRFRGTLLIHAAARVDRQACAAYAAAGIRLPAAGGLATGVIIGAVQVTGCVRDSPSRWALPGSWHWLTAAPLIAAPPVPVRGQLAMFTAPPGWDASFSDAALAAALGHGSPDGA